MITIQTTNKGYHFNSPKMEDAYQFEFLNLGTFISYFTDKYYYIPMKIWESIRDGSLIFIPKERPQEAE